MRHKKPSRILNFFKGLIATIMCALFFMVLGAFVFDVVGNFNPDIKLNLDAVHYYSTKFLTTQTSDVAYSSYLNNDEVCEAINSVPDAIEEYLDNNPQFREAFNITDLNIERMRRTSWHAAVETDNYYDDPSILALFEQPVPGFGYIRFYFDKIEQSIEYECANAGDYSYEYIKQLIQQVAAHEYIHALLRYSIQSNDTYTHYEEDVVQFIAEEVYPVYLTSNSWNGYTPGVRVVRCIFLSYGPEYGWNKLFQYANRDVLNLVNNASDVIAFYDGSYHMERGDYYTTSANGFLQEVYYNDTPNEEYYIESS